VGFTRLIPKVNKVIKVYLLLWIGACFKGDDPTLALASLLSCGGEFVITLILGNAKTLSITCVHLLSITRFGSIRF
jgi:hypothetical protein